MSKFRIFPKLDKVASSDDLRPIMKNAMLKDGYLVATNAHILFYARLDELTKQDGVNGLDELDGLLLGSQTLKFLGKANLSRIDFEKERLIAYAGKDKRVFYYSGVADPEQSGGNTFEGRDEITGDVDHSGDGKFPMWRDVVPSEYPQDGTSHFSFTPDLMSDLSDAFAGGGKGVTIQTGTISGPILVRPNDCIIEGQGGIVMPMQNPEPFITKPLN